MKKLILFLTIFLSSFGALSEPSFENEYAIHKRLELAIMPSFQEAVVYAVVMYRGEFYLNKKIFEDSSLNWQRVVSEENIKITEGQYKKIDKLLDKALDFKVKDDVRLEDGISWQLETSRYQWLKFRVSAPEYKTKERGYEGLLALGKYLQELVPDPNA